MLDKNPPVDDAGRIDVDKLIELLDDLFNFQI